MKSRKLLFVGDAACPSGFARSTHELLDVLSLTYDTTVLALNYRGDPHPYPYPIYAASPEGDPFGIGRLIWLCDLIKETVQDGASRAFVPRERHRIPDVIVVQNDPWNFPHYIRRLKSFPEYRDVPVVGIVAVDGKACLGDALNGLSSAVFWTQFGLDEARSGGYRGPASVIPLGVDLKTYYPMGKIAARRRRGIPPALDHAFIVGNVNRNQPRKRWDLTLRYFSEWASSGPLRDAYLYLHVAPTGDMGVEVRRLAAYYGIAQRLILVQPQTFYGVSEDEMRDTYNSFDVQVSTTQGEGFGLTTIEGMACGVPQIVPDWSALGEWCRGAARLVPCTSTAIGPPYVNVIGGVPDERAFVAEIEALCRSRALREETAALGLARAREARFRWRAIADQASSVVCGVVKDAEESRIARGERERAALDEARRVAWGLGGESYEAQWADLGRPEAVA